MDSAAIIVLALSLVSACGAALALSAHNSGLREKLSAATYDLKATNENLTETAREFGQYKIRSLKQLEALRFTIEDLESSLDECDDPDVLRSELRRVLQEAEGLESGPTPSWVS